MHYYFVTGSSRGIGKALCQELLKDKDSQVYGMSRSSSLAQEGYEHIEIDLSNPTVVKDFSFPSISDADEICLVNNAGTIGDVKHQGEIDATQIIDTIALNLTAPALLINAFLKKYSDSKAKLTILNISSGAATRAIESWSTYCASKAGLDMLSLVIEEERKLQKRENLRVFSIAPGIIDTEMQDVIRSVDEKDFSGVEHFRELKREMRLKSPNQTASQLVQVLKGTTENDGPLKRLD